MLSKLKLDNIFKFQFRFSKGMNPLISSYIISGPNKFVTTRVIDIAARPFWCYRRNYHNCQKWPESCLFMTSWTFPFSLAICTIMFNIFSDNVLYCLYITFQVSDCCLTPTQQFLGISWREQVNFQWDDDEVHHRPWGH
jgi:hypothetical protein